MKSHLKFRFPFLNSIQLLLMCAILTACGCENSKSATAQETGETMALAEGSIKASPSGLPFIGFNAKGDLDAPEQVALTDSLLSKLPAKVKSMLAIRVAGGTRSQKVSGIDWDDTKVTLWANLQKKHGIRLIYTVNGNDTPENQRRLIQRFIDAGAKFDFLEMMNEYYLAKFRVGKTERQEVTQKVTVDDYINKILPRFWKELDAFGIPYYVIYAPMKAPRTEKQNQHFVDWNKAMNKALNGQYADRDLNIVLHLYRKGPGPYDYDQIDRLRAETPKGRHIAITEAGVLDEDITYDQRITEIREHYKEIFKHLGSGDYLLDQVLYTNYKNDETATISSRSSDPGKLTAKGNMVVKFIRDHYE